ncbi:MAG: hypothetical protein ACMXYM_05115 [Candidatus Woesearchaeota archaeon]
MTSPKRSKNASSGRPPHEVRWDEHAFEEYEHLKEAVASERSSSSKPTYAQLLASVEHAIDQLKRDPYAGDLIPRKHLSKRVIHTYGTDRILRLELVGYWRMLYTIIGSESRIIALILEYMDHTRYDRLFGYRRR